MMWKRVRAIEATRTMDAGTVRQRLGCSDVNVMEV